MSRASEIFRAAYAPAREEAARRLAQKKNGAGDVAGQALSRATQGAGMGAKLGPKGAAIGGGIGALIGTAEALFGSPEASQAVDAAASLGQQFIPTGATPEEVTEKAELLTKVKGLKIPKFGK